MSKITKKQLHNGWHCHDTEIIKMKKELRELKQSVLRLEKLTDEKLLDEPQLKQLDQSVFDGLDEKWQFAAVDKCGEVWYSTHKTQPSVSGTHLSPEPNADSMQAKGYYDASNWQNSLIERDIAKELLEVDLSSDLTGSELCKAMLARGDGYVVCLVSNVADSHAIKNREHTTLIEQWVERDGFYNYRSQNWGHAVPANPATNEPLTAADVGL